jgi:hypothetical protein
LQRRLAARFARSRCVLGRTRKQATTPVFSMLARTHGCTAVCSRRGQLLLAPGPERSGLMCGCWQGRTAVQLCALDAGSFCSLPALNDQAGAVDRIEGRHTLCFVQMSLKQGAVPLLASLTAGRTGRAPAFLCVSQDESVSLPGLGSTAFEAIRAAPGWLFPGQARALLCCCGVSCAGISQRKPGRRPFRARSLQMGFRAPEPFGSALHAPSDALHAILVPPDGRR